MILLLHILLQQVLPCGVSEAESATEPRLHSKPHGSEGNILTVDLSGLKYQNQTGLSVQTEWQIKEPYPIFPYFCLWKSPSGELGPLLTNVRQGKGELSKIGQRKA